tara:strand:+ start:2134 stop:3099 length:966 start_codon:yes stop_codon:yes gene_type:complete
MKLILKIVLLLFLCSPVLGQNVKMIHKGLESDSSFYHIEKVNDNEFWAGGEYGILKKIDTLGNVSSLNFPNEGIDILKIKKVKEYVFITTANAIIYRYDIKKKTFIIKTFPEFNGKCFYDLIELKNGELLLCGGTTEIAIAKKKIPNGFIAILDEDLNYIEVVWKNKMKFVWSLLASEHGGVSAVTFNGINTEIIKSEDLKSWEKDIKIKGLVHEITAIDNQLWYCGAKNIHFKRDGIIGNRSNGQKKLKNTGCLWSLNTVGSKIIAATQSGELLRVDKMSNEIEYIETQKTSTIYGFEIISEYKILVVGSGNTLFLMNTE